MTEFTEEQRSKFLDAIGEALGIDFTVTEVEAGELKSVFATVMPKNNRKLLDIYATPEGRRYVDAFTKTFSAGAPMAYLLMGLPTPN